MATVPLTQQQISDFISTGLLELPAGNFSVSSQIDFGSGYINGIRLQGAGQSYATTETSNDRQVTRLYWLGDPDTPMIKGHIRHGVFKDIQILNGRIWIDPVSGWGTGLSQFERVSFHGAKSGVLFGGTYNGNAADSRFRDCQFNRCEVCVEITSSQNVNYGMDGCMFYRCGPIFQLAGGGLCNVDSCYLTQVPIVFKLTGDGTQTGQQNGNFSVTNLRYDASQDVKPTIVRDTGSYGSGRELFVVNIHAPPLGINYVDSDNTTWSLMQPTGITSSTVFVAGAGALRASVSTMSGLAASVSSSDADVNSVTLSANIATKNLLGSMVV